MIARFDRNMIASINSTQSVCSNKNKNAHGNKRIAVPEKETFKYIFGKAKQGNEMAAVLIDEWQSSCKPKDEQEEQMIRSIYKAANKIFR